jgi:hypothetical protein
VTAGVIAAGTRAISYVRGRRFHAMKNTMARRGGVNFPTDGHLFLAATARGRIRTPHPVERERGWS